MPRFEFDENYDGMNSSGNGDPRSYENIFGRHNVCAGTSHKFKEQTEELKKPRWKSPKPKNTKRPKAKSSKSN